MNYMLNGKAAVVLIIVGHNKKDIVLMIEYFPERKSLGGRAKV